MSHRDIDTFSEFEPEFRERVERMVWCCVATIDTQNRPSTRLLHPMWEGQTGWIGTHKNSTKRLHLEKNPHVSLAYVSDIARPVHIEAVATWVTSPVTRQHVWNLFLNTPEPLGYDPAPLFVAPDHENFGVLRIEPWKITLATLGGNPWQKIWRASRMAPLSHFDASRFHSCTAGYLTSLPRRDRSEVSAQFFGDSTN